MDSESKNSNEISKTSNSVDAGEKGNEVEQRTFNYTKKEEAALMRKVDVNLLIILGVLYAFALIDRINISAAMIAGMEHDMDLVGNNRYSIITLVFFIPYVLVELPSNVFIRKVSPRWFLGTIATSWGAVMLGMGWSKNWTHLVACRVLLGAFEGGYFPACAFLIQSWYTRKEVQIRYAYFYYISVTLTGFSSIMGWGLGEMDDYGIEGWRWIFIVAGAITMGLGLLCFIFVQDFPDRKSRFLTEEQIAFIRYRIEKDRGDSKSDVVDFKTVLLHLRDYRLWCYALCFMAASAASYSNGYFLPIILRNMGFNFRDSMLLSIPPVIFAVILGLAVSWVSDKIFMRAPGIIFQAVLVLVGIILVAYTKHTAAQYFGCFINVAGAQGNVPALLAYSANNICSYSKRAASSGLTIMFGAIGGIYATTVYRGQDAPKYIPATWAIVAAQFFIMALIGILTKSFIEDNKKQKAGKVLEGTPGFTYTI